MTGGIIILINVGALESNLAMDNPPLLGGFSHEQLHFCKGCSSQI
jgi:hypothetical protein